jgi:hypothetical protein
MRFPSRMASGAHHSICPFCEVGALRYFGPGFARCDLCGLPRPDVGVGLRDRPRPDVRVGTMS